MADLRRYLVPKARIKTRAQQPCYLPPGLLKENRRWVVDLASNNNFNSISPHGFKALKSDDNNVSMVHSLKRGMSVDHVMAPPVSMLLTFSGHLRSRKEEMQTSRDGHYRFELYGGTCAAVADVFAMMKWWCDGKKTVPTYQEAKRFIGLFQLYEAAQVLQVPDPLFEVIERRLNKVVEAEIPYDEDLAEVYEHFLEGHEARWYTLDAWVSGYLSGRFNLEEDVSELFWDLPDLQRDVNDAVAEQKQRWGFDEVRDRVEEIGGRRKDDVAIMGSGEGLGGRGQVTLPYR